MSEFPASFNVSDLDGSNGFSILGINSQDNLGFDIDSAGDINNDGIDDIIIGARFANANGIEKSGESYVIFGSDTAFSNKVDVSTLDGSNGFTIGGVDANDVSGQFVSGLGDINHDGIDDVIVSAPGADPNGTSRAGESYVIFGSESAFSASFNLSNIDGNNGFIINGIDEDDFSGGSVTGIGDINSDGIDDFAIGSPSADPNSRSSAGESYVVFGSSVGFGNTLELSALDGSNGFIANGFDYTGYSGYAVSGAGDINNDGIDDLIIGAYLAAPDGRQQAGETYVVFGSTAGFSGQFELSDLNGSNGFTLNGINAKTPQRTFGDFSGISVSEAGDVNGDGIDDVIVGAFRASPNGRNGAGESYVIFGSSTGFGPSFELSSLDGSNGFALHGVDASDSSGASVSGAGDINNDGFSDIIIGARNAKAPNGSSVGESYVVYGKSSSFSASLELSSLDGTNGFLIRTEQGASHLGQSVSKAGDINGDGISDIVVGAPYNGTRGAGEGYVIFGRVDDPFAGDDVIEGLLGDNIIDAGAGNDIVYAKSGNDTLDGGSGSDRIYANGGNDIVKGGSGNDTVHGGAGNDDLEGGLNNDILDGGTGDDHIKGDSGDDTLLGYADNDQLEGGTGNDRLFGHEGNDTLSGGDDNDNLYGGSGADIINGDEGNDRLYGGEGEDTITGGAGNDWLSGNADNDTLNGNSGDDFLYGGGGDDTLDGGEGNDLIFAQAGNDTAIGGAGNDVIYGGAGDDTLIGGGLSNASFAGQVDRLYGGSGSDTYVIENRYEADADRDLAIIRGFNKAEDTIQLSSDTHTLANVQTGSGLYATSGTGIYNSSGDLLAVIESHVVGSLDLQASYFVVA